MAPVLLKVLEFLRTIRIASKRFPGRGSSLLALLGRKLKQWWRFCLGKFGRPKPAVRPFHGTEASSYSVSDASAVVSEYVVAASHVPASASRSSLHDRTQGQPATLGVPAISVDPPHVHHPHPLYGRGILNRSTVSIQSRASDRLSIITNSRESIRPPLGQPSRLPRGIHRQFGRGPDPSRSRERATRPSSPTGTTRPHTPHRPPSIRTNLSSPAPGDGRVSPVVQSPASSITHELRSALSMHERGRIRSQSTMMAVDVENPSTDSLPTSFSSNPPQITDEPPVIDHLTARLSPDFPAVNLPGSPTDNSLPENRFIQLINSEQVPRYTKDVTMQVGHSSYLYTLTPLCRSREETPYDVYPLTTEFPQYVVIQ